MGDDVDHVVRAGEGEQLGTHGEPAGLVAGQLQHATTLVARGNADAPAVVVSVTPLGVTTTELMEDR